MSSASTVSGPRQKPTLPPGPRDPVRSTLGFQRDPLKFLDQLNRRYGDISRFRLLTTPTVVLNHPSYVKYVLQDNHLNYNKDSPAHRMARSFFGTGLSTLVGGQEWRRQRRLVQPAFHRQRIAALGGTMSGIIESNLDRWRQHEVLDIGAEMSRTAIEVFTHSLFALDAAEEGLHRFMQAGVTVTAELAAYMRLPLVPLSVPTPGHRRFHASLRAMHEVAQAAIDRYRAEDRDRGDLLSMLMHAVDGDTGEGMSDAELRDEIIGLLFAGYETSARVLTWALYLLARHPDIASRVREEIDGALDGRPPVLGDLPKLEYVRAVIEETMRLYPPGWQNFRYSISDDEIGGHLVPAGTQIFWNAYSLHRHPDFWAAPDKFDPDRFAPSATHERGAYVPFGAGPRICVGNVFAMAEMQMVIAMIFQRHRFELTSTDEVLPLPSVTLGTAGPVRMRLHARR